METWQVWLISITGLLLSCIFITLLIYLTLALRTVRNKLAVFEAKVGDILPVLDFIAGVKAAKKQAQQSSSEQETLNRSRSHEIGRLTVDMATTGIALWKILRR